jgi:hypothetical protein
MNARRLPKNTLVKGTMYYVELESKEDRQQFLDWMHSVQEFPFSIYLGGITYTFTDYLFRDMFIVGFNAGLEVGDSTSLEDMFEGL